jgi:hypothetical protein
MNIRNKRIAIERERMSYVLSEEEEVDGEVMKLDCPELGVSLHFEKSYPFTSPIVMVDGQLSIIKFMKQFRNVQPLLVAYNIPCKCVCCSDLTCAWSPCYGIREILDEYSTISTHLNSLESYANILKHLPFDDLVHRQVLLFL